MSLAHANSMAADLHSGHVTDPEIATTAARQLHSAGRLDEAQAIYSEVLGQVPDHAEALHLLGVLALQRGAPEVAEQLLRRAHERVPSRADVQCNHGAALRALQRLAEAEETFRNAAELAPGQAEIWHNLGCCVQALGRGDEAIAIFHRALSLAPDRVDTINALATALLDMDRLDEAQLALDDALTRDPGHRDALLNMANLRTRKGQPVHALEFAERAVEPSRDSIPALRTLAAIQIELGRPIDASRTLDHCLALSPRDPESLHLSALCLHASGRSDTALERLVTAIELAPRQAGIRASTAKVLLDLDRHEEAVAISRSAQAIDQGCASAALNLACGLRVAGRLDDALEAAHTAHRLAPLDPATALTLSAVLSEQQRIADARLVLEQAIMRAPEHAELRWNLAINHLACGELGPGWRGYEWRWRCSGFGSPLRRYPQRPWDGSLRPGRRITIWPEQGIGDQILLASMLQDLVAQGAQCVLECAPKLARLFARSFPAIEVIATGEDAPLHPAGLRSEYQTPIGGLCRWLRPDLASYPQHRAYLRADAARTRHWRDWLRRQGDGPFVGICWASGNLRAERRLASTDLTDWAGILDNTQATFVRLQHRPKGAHGNVEHAAGLLLDSGVDLFDDLDESAALIAALDLVISAPSSTSVLSAALGVETWQLTCGMDWHALGQRHSPWQPAMRRHYRAWNQSWAQILSDAAIELAQRIHSGELNRATPVNRSAQAQPL